jgi:hypothetical protein
MSSAESNIVKKVALLYVDIKNETTYLKCMQCQNLLIGSLENYDDLEYIVNIDSVEEVFTESFVKRVKLQYQKR